MRHSVHTLLLGLGLLSTLNLELSTCLAQNTAFTYQGRLTDTGAPVNGRYDFRAALFDSPSHGNVLGATNVLSNVAVSNGLFTVQFDFGDAAFVGGGVRWLELAVRTHGSTDGYATLAPRQPLTPAPMALWAGLAGTAYGAAPNAISTAALQDAGITGAKIAGGQVVRSLNGLTDAVTLTAGSNITVTPVGNSVQIAARTTTGLAGQSEPRTPITAVPFVIASSGSYYLTTNLTVPTGDAITVRVPNVTLDLLGFTLSSSASDATGTAVRLETVDNVTIMNGHIAGGVTYRLGVYSGGGFLNGISYAGFGPSNVRVVHLSVSGCRGHGIFLGFLSTRVESCSVKTTGGFGIVAEGVYRSTASVCGDTAIGGGVVNSCSGESISATGAGHGISAKVASDCQGVSVTGKGVYANSALNCYGYSLNHRGVEASTAQSCYGYNNGDDRDDCGVYAESASNCYGFSTHGVGIRAKRVATNCSGYAAGAEAGLESWVANNCYAYNSGSGRGLVATIAIGCFGYCDGPGGRGLQVQLANSCGGGGTETNIIDYTYDMPGRGTYNP